MSRYQTTISIFLVLVILSAYYKYTQEKNNTYNFKTISYYQVYSLNKPKDISFCGEVVPMHKKHVQEKIDEAVYHYSSLRRKTHRIIKRVNYWFPKMEKIIQQYGLPEDLKYLAVVESNLRNVESHKGAKGYWQFMEATAVSMGLNVNEEEEIDERLDPLKSTRAACKYFRIANRQFNNWSLAAASYNMGITGVQRQLEIQRKDSYFDLKLNSETANYVYRAIALKEILENRAKYGFYEEELHYHEPLEQDVEDAKLLMISPSLF